MSLPAGRPHRRSDRAPLIRHLALCAAVPVAWYLRADAGIGYAILAVVGAAAVINLLLNWRPLRPRLGLGVSILSSALGLAGWSALAALTGGLASPFIAGLFLEVVLSISRASTVAIALTTLGAVAGLWAQVIVTGLAGRATPVLLLTGFLLLLGGLTLQMASRWRRARTRMARRIVALRQRLSRLETSLDEKRGIPGVSEDTARLAHALKNTVHSMRGFVRLLEPQITTSPRCLPLLDGLRSAIDHLEETAGATLGPCGPRAGSLRVEEALTPRAVREIVDQVAAAFPGMKWSLRLDGMPPCAGAPAPLIRDALGNVLRNAAEAMQGKGEVQVEALTGDGRCEIRVTDRGPGLRPEAAARLFEPGRTTKAGGHGLGLFLARRLLEEGGGRLTLSPADCGGVLCSMELPLWVPDTLASARM